MRILRLNFANLNSLIGKWEIDFTDKNLTAYGLYLITGPTGAGKSTILDAIVLALYGETTRGRPSKSGNALMSHNTEECWSQVEFMTGKGHFIARFEQKWRNGRLDPPRRAFWKYLDGKPVLIAETIREVERAVIENTGLDYGQFTRSVLLAQGKFDNFLKADECDKSKILEKLTSTDIYSHLSNLAFTKEKEEREKLERLDARRADLQVLDPAAEAEKRNEIQAAQTRLESIASRIKKMQEEISWLVKLEEYRKNGSLLASQWEQLEQRIKNSDWDRKKLADGRIAQKLESFYTKLQAIRNQVAAVDNDLFHIVIRQKEAAASLASFEDLCQKMTQAHEQAEEQLANALPLLKKARELDINITERSRELADWKAAEEKARQRLAEAKEKSLKYESEKQQLKDEMAALDNWLEENANAEWLVENFGAIKEAVSGLDRRWQDLGVAEARVEALAKDVEATARMIEECEIKEKLARQKHRDTQALLTDIVERRNALLAGWTLEGLREALKEREIVEATIRSLEEHRAHLRTGEECPLCGSRDHPWANQVVADAITSRTRELSAQIRDVEQCIESLDRVEKDRDEAGAEAEKRYVELDALREKLELQNKNLLEGRTYSADLKRDIMDTESRIRQTLESGGQIVEQDIKHMVSALENKLGAWRDAQARKTQGDAKAAALEPQLSALYAQAARSDEEILHCTEKVAALEADLEELKKKRSGIFAGAEADEIETRLKAETAHALNAMQGASEKAAGARQALEAEKGAEAVLLQQKNNLVEAKSVEEERFSMLLQGYGWTEEHFLVSRDFVTQVEELESRQRRLDEEKLRLSALIRNNNVSLENEARKALTDKSYDDVRAEEKAANEELNRIYSQRALLLQELKENEKNMGKLAELNSDREAQLKEYQKWQELDSLIGSENGKKFSSFAQNVTLDVLLRHANIQLARITDRYQLKRSSKKSLMIDIVDNYQAGAVRSIDTLSGGETFLASLALSLGLSAMSRSGRHIGSLFLDEGFGTLDAEKLRSAIEVIRNLHQEGKLIGIISHVDALQNEIPAKIQVIQKGMGRSELQGPGCVSQRSADW